ncbi:MAG: hypothetical protein V3S70_11255 [Gammaproteobacteria bacterium]
MLDKARVTGPVIIGLRLGQGDILLKSIRFGGPSLEILNIKQFLRTARVVPARNLSITS